MREGVYRVKVVVIEVREVRRVETRIKAWEGVKNSMVRRGGLSGGEVREGSCGVGESDE